MAVMHTTLTILFGAAIHARAELLGTLADGSPCRSSRDAVTIVRWGAPWCRSCRTIGPDLQEFVASRWPAGKIWQVELVRDGKAAGERMYKHYKARGVREMPLFEVFVGSELVERLDARTLRDGHGALRASPEPPTLQKN